MAAINNEQTAIWIIELLNEGTTLGVILIARIVVAKTRIWFILVGFESDAQGFVAIGVTKERLQLFRDDHEVEFACAFFVHSIVIPAEEDDSITFEFGATFRTLDGASESSCELINLNSRGTFATDDRRPGNRHVETTEGDEGAVRYVSTGCGIEKRSGKFVLRVALL